MFPEPSSMPRPKKVAAVAAKHAPAEVEEAPKVRRKKKIYLLKKKKKQIKSDVQKTACLVVKDSGKPSNPG